MVEVQTAALRLARRREWTRRRQTMRRKILLAGLALAIVAPAAASAQETCEQRAHNRVAGTAVGAVAGALVGSAVGGRHDGTSGAVVGGLAGAVIGNQVAKGPADCRHAYGWYDNGGRWHANNVDSNAAWGYYDRRGEWVAGQPADYRPAPRRPGPAWDDDRDWGRGGDPELSRWEDRLRAEIREGVRDGRIERDEARGLMGQLRDIRRDEAREADMHGDHLPREARERLRDRLRHLDRRIGHARRYD
jgi:hypothetical protein